MDSYPAKTGHANQGTLQAVRYVATVILEDGLVLQKAGREDLRVLPACPGLWQMKVVNNVREAIEIAMSGGQASVTIGPATMIAGNGGHSLFADPDCDHFFDDGFCLLCDDPEPVEDMQ